MEMAFSRIPLEMTRAELCGGDMRRSGWKARVCDVVRSSSWRRWSWTWISRLVGSQATSTTASSSVRSMSSTHRQLTTAATLTPLQVLNSNAVFELLLILEIIARAEMFHW